MPAFIALLPLLAGAPVDVPRPTPVACAVMASGKCVYAGPVAGNGGAGGSASVNIIVVPQGGTGGAGGNASGGAAASGSNHPTAARPDVDQAPRDGVATRCTMTIAGNVQIDARQCGYTLASDKFLMKAPSANGHHFYTAWVDITPDRNGFGSLSSDGTGAVRALGRMTRDGACWRSVDGTVSLCAWR